MLSSADRDVAEIIRFVTSQSAEAGDPVPTSTGLRKSILDAHQSLRDYLAKVSIHDFESQRQGPDFKVVLKAHILTKDGWVPTQASLYRPNTKTGDPRIWFSKLTSHVKPHNLLAVFAFEGELFVVNTSEASIWEQRNYEDSPFRQLLSSIATPRSSAHVELTSQLRLICGMGFVRSTTNSDSGVGDTLESLLGIRRNSSRNPDFMGIELKTSRASTSNRSNLFSAVPEWSLSELKNSKQLVEAFGYLPHGSDLKALQVTVSSKPNPQTLFFSVNEAGGLIENRHKVLSVPNPAVVWKIATLQSSLADKHKDTFWIRANRRETGGWEEFHYTKATVTTSPVVANFSLLVETGAITMDYTISEKRRVDGSRRMRDHGYLWKIRPADLDLLFPPPYEIDLATS